MEIVEMKNSLEKFADENIIVSKIVAKMLAIPNIQTLKFDMEISKYVANVIHNELKTHTLDEQKAVIIKIIKAVFQNTFTEAETAILLSQITYLVNNKQVKKVSTRKYIYKSVGNWISKRLS
jgi:hypothetical protein